jgi:hypothetical protein
MGRRATKLAGWMARWGFATLVGLGGIVAAGAAWRIEVPAQVPSFALLAPPVYRLEVGAAVFVGIYLAAMAFVLALHNRGFSEIGASGMKAQDLRGTTLDQAYRDHERLLGLLEKTIAQLHELDRDAAREQVKFDSR